MPEFQRRGGKALLYTEMEKTIRDNNFEQTDMVQVAETAVQMRRDLANVGVKPFKNHRVFIKDV
ncbi:MAG TPA: hypothetical protein ENI27_05135 [bacterium]|nr:hypothetical protein [bacterium]